MMRRFAIELLHETANECEKRYAVEPRRRKLFAYASESITNIVKKIVEGDKKEPSPKDG